MKINLRVTEIKDSKEMQKALSIRREVFIEEQNVPAKREIDGLDNKARQFLLYEEDLPVGTLRVFINSDFSEVTVGRVAIIKSRRNKGYGKYLLTSVFSLLAEEHTPFRVVLAAQVQAQGFYTALGFKKMDDKIFMDAGIKHIKMSKIIEGRK